ncbi:hypothetical protein A3715_16860 [Oleiphilus sp. HI0009]|nr:hypothetical protein A3715_16860 [Oleiphilus sp. HI0009]
MIKTLSKFVFFFVASLSLVGCFGLPSELTDRYDAIEEQLKQHEVNKKNVWSKFEKSKTIKQWTFLKPYSEKEKWDSYLEQSNKLTEKAKTYWKTTLKQRMDRDKSREAFEFQKELNEFDKMLSSALAKAGEGIERGNKIVDTRNKVSTIFSLANDNIARIKIDHGDVVALADKAKAEYTHKKDDLVKKASVIEALLTESIKAHEVVVGQTENHKNNDLTDYAALLDNSNTLKEKRKETYDYALRTKAKINQLFRSYTKILADQKIDFFVKIGRATWCEGEYCGRGDESVYPAQQVDEAVYEYFDEQYTGDLIAKETGGWSFSRKLHLYTSQSMWNALKIDLNYKRDSSFDYSEFWIEDNYALGYHKYIEIENDKQTTTDWVRIEENDFWKTFDDLGMAVVTKPYGYYEEDALNKSEPAGMAMIAAPIDKNGVATGSNEYGEWRTDNNGNSFWYYYGIYSFMNDIVGRPYGYGHYNHYRSRDRNKSYYGEDDYWGSYGLYTYDNGRYSNTEYAKSYSKDVKETKQRRKERTVRGSGPKGRGKGPSGGGK